MNIHKLTGTALLRLMDYYLGFLICVHHISYRSFVLAQMDMLTSIIQLPKPTTLYHD